MAGLRRIDGDELVDLLLAQWLRRGDGDHRFAHVTGEFVDQPLDGLQITAVAQIAGRMLGQTLGHLVEVRIADQAVEQLDAGFGRDGGVIQLAAYDRKVEQCGMQLGKLDGDLQSSIRVVRVVHHAIHTEILGGVGDVGHAAPTAGHQIGHDFHRQRMGLISNEGLDYRNLVFDWARRVGEGTFKLDVVVERVGDREQFVPDAPCVLAAVAQPGGQRVTRNAVCDTRCFSSHWSPPFLEGFDHFLSLSRSAII